MFNSKYLVAILLILVASSSFSRAQEIKSQKRLQLAVGTDSNLFEDSISPVANQYLRGFIKHQWRRISSSNMAALDLAFWGLLYKNYSEENKFLIDLNASYSYKFTDKLRFAARGYSQVKSFLQRQNGYVQFGAEPQVNVQLNRTNRIGIGAILNQYRFFQVQEFDLNQYLAQIFYYNAIQPRLTVGGSLLYGWIVLPNRRYLTLTENQQNIYQGIQADVSWQKGLLLHGLLRLDKEESNVPGLDYFRFTLQMIFVYRLNNRLFLRGNLRWQKKRYEGTNIPNQTIGVDAEIGEGSDGNIDTIYALSDKISIIFRIRMLRYESILRNIYYSKRLFELILETR